MSILVRVRKHASSIQRTDFNPVSWAYGGGRPGGEVAEKKDEGEIGIQSKRGNTIKRNAEPDNPAVHVKRPGNDVVKRQSELDVEEKKNDNASAADGDANKGDDMTAPATEDKPQENNANNDNLAVPETNGAQGKEKSKSPAPKAKSPAPKKAPTPKATPAAASKKRKVFEEPAEEEAADGEEPAAGDEPPAKKARGRPKGSGNAKPSPKPALKAAPKPKPAPKPAPKPKAAPKEAPAAEKKKPGRKPAAASAAKTKKDDAPKEASNGADTPKGRGRPKGSGGVKKSTAAKKDKKAPAPAVKGTVGSRTRSTKK